MCVYIFAYLLINKTKNLQKPDRGCPPVACEIKFLLFIRFRVLKLSAIRTDLTEYEYNTRFHFAGFNFSLTLTLLILLYAYYIVLQYSIFNWASNVLAYLVSNIFYLYVTLLQLHIAYINWKFP